MPFPAMMSCFSCKQLRQHLIVHGHWSKTRSLPLLKLRTGKGDVASISGPQLDHALKQIPSSQSGLPPSPQCKASEFPQCQTSLVLTPLCQPSTHIHAGQDLSSGSGTVIPETSQCLGGQGNDQHMWRPHFPLCLRTHLGQRLFKLIFFHREHLANFFLH